MALPWKSEPFEVRCPHCGQENELATSFDGESLAEAVRAADFIVLICSRCVGVWINAKGENRAITPEEWLDLPAENRGEIQRHVRALKEWNRRRLRRP